MTERLARAASRRPWPVVGAWILAIVLALVAIALLLPGALTSEQRLTNNPSSYQADSLVAQHFKRAEVNEIVQSETDAWLSEFGNRLSELEARLQQQSVQGRR